MNPTALDPDVCREHLAEVLAEEAALLAELVLLVVLWAAGPVLGSVQLTHLGSWIQATAPSDALTGLVRLAGMVLAGWLLVSTVLYLAASLAGAEGLVRRTGWVTRSPRSSDPMNSETVLGRPSTS